MKKTVLAKILAIAALLSVVGSASADESTVPTIRVRYDDLNLASAAGMETLTRRIKVAAARVCRSPVSSTLHVGTRAYGDCIRSTTDQAISQVKPGASEATHE